MDSNLTTLVLTDGREFKGCVVIEGPDFVSLVWTDRGVNHEVCVPRALIVKCR